MLRRMGWMLSLASALTFCNGAAGRQWTDVSGQFTRDAELVGVDGDRVHLKQIDGAEISIGLDQLSDRDRAVVERRARLASAADPFQETRTDGARPASASGAVSPAGMHAEFLPAPEPTDLQAAQEPAGAPLDEYGSHPGCHPKKYVYCGCRGTFHLIDFGPKCGIGTAHYCYCCDPPCCEHDCCDCCEHCKWYLALIKKTHEDCHFFYYKPCYGDCCIDEWAFSKCSDCCDCKYSVYYHLRGEPPTCWHHFECADRSRPC